MLPARKVACSLQIQNCILGCVKNRPIIRRHLVVVIFASNFDIMMVKYFDIPKNLCYNPHKPCVDTLDLPCKTLILTKLRENMMNLCMSCGRCKMDFWGALREPSFYSQVIPDLFYKEIRSGDKRSTFLELYLKLPSNLDHNLSLIHI